MGCHLFRQCRTALPASCQQGADEGIMKARRSESDLAERRDSLILHKFEAIFSWVENLNMNRRIEDVKRPIKNGGITQRMRANI